MRWKYQKFIDEVHESLAHIALYHGLTYYYHNFNSPIFRSIKEFNDLGGIQYLKDYFKTRGNRYDFPTEISSSAKNSLIWLAWNRDDFQTFNFFMTEFEDVLSTRRYASAYWQNRFAQFYLRHKDYENAIEYFNTGIFNYAESDFLAEMHFGLGNAYFGKNNNNDAISNYKMAVKIAKKNSDMNLESYKEQLLAVKK